MMQYIVFLDGSVSYYDPDIHNGMITEHFLTYADSKQQALRNAYVAGFLI